MEMNNSISPLQWAPDEPFWAEPRINAALSVLYAEPPNTWLDKRAVSRLAREKYGYEFPWSDEVELNFDGFQPKEAIRALSKLDREYEPDTHPLEVIKPTTNERHYYPSIGNDSFLVEADQELMDAFEWRLKKGTDRLDGFSLVHLADREGAGTDEAIRAITKLLCQDKIYRHVVLSDTGFSYEYWVDSETEDQEDDALGW